MRVVYVPTIAAWNLLRASNVLLYIAGQIGRAHGKRALKFAKQPRYQQRACGLNSPPPK